MGAEHTSVPIIFFAKALISFTARGARFLKPMPCSSFRRWTVYSRVTTSVAAVAFFLSPFTLHEEGSEGSARGREMAHTTGDSTTSGVWRRTGPQRRLAAASHGEETSTPSASFPTAVENDKAKSSLPLCVSFHC